MPVSPRPTSIESIRRFRFQAQYDYYENGLGGVETKQLELEFGTEFNRGDDVTLSLCL